MNSFKKLIRVISFFALVLVFESPIHAQLRAEYLSPSYPTGDRIPIVASTPIPEGFTPTRQAYVDLIDCGFNLGMTNGNINYFKEQFELIGDMNFRYLIENNALHDNRRKEIIDAFKNEPKLAGWKFSDEPKFENLDVLKKECQILREEDPYHLIYINTVGEIAPNFTGPYKDFSKYIKFFNNTLNPTILSYDFYPISTKNGKLEISYEIFYSDLEIFMKMSRSTNKPFWAYCESMAYTSKYMTRPPATEAFLRFEAFSALAYGAQGIVYWTYAQRKSNDVETYLSALVDLSGKKYQAWYNAKKVNAEIIKYNDVFFKSSILEVRHCGDKIYKNTQRLTGKFGPFRNIKGSSEGFLISRIKKEDNYYDVIVSRDVKSSQIISAELNPGRGVVDLTNENRELYLENGKIELKLDAGGYIIFREI